MTIQEINQALGELVKSEWSSELRKKGRELLDAYQDISVKKQKDEREAFLENGGTPEVFRPSRTEDDNNFDQLWATFSRMQSEADEKLRRAQRDNFETKKAIIEEIGKLKTEENIKKSYERFELLQEKWNSIGAVPSAQLKDLQSEYSRVRDEFFYTMHIYRELLENDLRKNLQVKQDIIKKMKDLMNLDDIREMEKMARKYTNEWNEVGPTFHNLWEGVRDEFWKVHHEIYDKVKHFFHSQKEVQAENLKQKELLVAALKEINERERDSEKKWNKATQKVIELQKEWKTIGFAGKQENERIWNDFREQGDIFFGAKSKYFLSLKEVHDKRKEAKQRIIEKTSAIMEAADFHKNTRDIVQLQNDWKKVGTTHHRDEQRLWKRFRELCNAYFEKKKEHFKKLEGEQDNNLNLKEEVIEQLRNFKPTEDPSADKTTIDGLAAKFNEIGFVPIKSKQKISQDFHNALRNAYKTLGLTKKKTEEALFELKVEEIKNTQEPTEALRKELAAINEKIKSINHTILQYENNMGFFGHGKGAQALKAEVEKKLNREREIKENLEKKTRILKSTLNKLK
ncbi:MAG TPA: hypothetical protein DDX92_00860 [Flavobacteriales bacterium]|jgi:hypothetical protein|nr:hypothetical protein [Flavobacteriales bacterium]